MAYSKKARAMRSKSGGSRKRQYGKKPKQQKQSLRRRGKRISSKRRRYRKKRNSRKKQKGGIRIITFKKALFNPITHLFDSERYKKLFKLDIDNEKLIINIEHISLITEEKFKEHIRLFTEINLKYEYELFKNKIFLKNIIKESFSFINNPNDFETFIDTILDTKFYKSNFNIDKLIQILILFIKKESFKTDLRYAPYSGDYVSDVYSKKKKVIQPFNSHKKKEIDQKLSDVHITPTMIHGLPQTDNSQLTKKINTHKPNTYTEENYDLTKLEDDRQRKSIENLLKHAATDREKIDLLNFYKVPLK